MIAAAGDTSTVKSIVLLRLMSASWFTRKFSVTIKIAFSISFKRSDSIMIKDLTTIDSEWVSITRSSS